MNRPWATAREPRQKVPAKDNFLQSPEWVRKSTRYKKSHPFCAIGRRSGRYDKVSDVDHVIPREYGGDKFADDNLQSLSKHRHSAKTGYEIRAQGPIYESIDLNGSLRPAREWGKLLPLNRKPIMCIIGPSGAGKSTLIEAIRPKRYFTHIHHIDDTNWSMITDSVYREPGYHLIECVGSHFAFRKLLMDQRLSFFVVRVEGTQSACLSRRKNIAVKDWLGSSFAQSVIPADLTIEEDDRDYDKATQLIINKTFGYV